MKPNRSENLNNCLRRQRRLRGLRQSDVAERITASSIELKTRHSSIKGSLLAGFQKKEATLLVKVSLRLVGR